MCKQSQWWDESIFDMVDWPAHGQALKRHAQHHTTLVKFLHQIPPIGKQVHKYDPTYPPTCPSCHHEKEDMTHFWKCQAPTGLEWRRQFLKELKSKLIELGTGPEVRDFLVSKIRAVLDGKDPETKFQKPRSCMQSVKRNEPSSGIN